MTYDSLGVDVKQSKTSKKRMFLDTEFYNKTNPLIFEMNSVYICFWGCGHKVSSGFTNEHAKFF